MYRNLISFPLDHIINSDEILLKASKDGAKVTRLEAHYKAGGSDVLDDSSSIGSLTPFVSAAGTLWLLVFCLKIPPQNSKNHPFRSLFHSQRDKRGLQTQYMVS